MSSPTDTPTGTGAPTQDGSLLGDRIVAAIVIVLGAVVLFLAFGFPAPGQPEDPGTAALPRLIGGKTPPNGLEQWLGTQNIVKSAG